MKVIRVDLKGLLNFLNSLEETPEICLSYSYNVVGAGVYTQLRINNFLIEGACGYTNYIDRSPICEVVYSSKWRGTPIRQRLCR